jgi:hypothetical protein
VVIAPLRGRGLTAVMGECIAEKGASEEVISSLAPRGGAFRIE